MEWKLKTVALGAAAALVWGMTPSSAWAQANGGTVSGGQGGSATGGGVSGGHGGGTTGGNANGGSAGGGNAGGGGGGNAKGANGGDARGGNSGNSVGGQGGAANGGSGGSGGTAGAGGTGGAGGAGNTVTGGAGGAGGSTGGNDANPCFPADATVRDATGATKSMRDVVVGDRLQVVEANGSLGYEDVYLLTHKDATIASRYLEIGLASGQSLTLSPRHFIPVAPGGQGSWESHVLKGADEVKAGDVVWHAQADGTMAPAEVTTVSSRTEVGAFNPLTLSGTIVVDGVVASAHSNWFLDGIVAADTQGKVYQAMFAPVRATYRLIGPDWTREISERWGVVDFVRENTPQTAILAAVIVVSSIGAGVALRRRRAAAA